MTLDLSSKEQVFDRITGAIQAGFLLVTIAKDTPSGRSAMTDLLIRDVTDLENSFGGICGLFKQHSLQTALHKLREVMRGDREITVRYRNADTELDAETIQLAFANIRLVTEKMRQWVIEGKVRLGGQTAAFIQDSSLSLTLLDEVMDHLDIPRRTSTPINRALGIIEKALGRGPGGGPDEGEPYPIAM